MVRAALHRIRRPDRSADATQRPAGGIRPVALGAARPRPRTRGAVPAGSLSDSGAAIREIFAKRTRLIRPDCVRSDRDDMAIAVALGAIAERAVDRILFI